MAYAPHHSMRDPAVEGRTALMNRFMQRLQAQQGGGSNGGPAGINPGGPMNLPQQGSATLSPQLLALLQQRLASNTTLAGSGDVNLAGGMPNAPSQGMPNQAPAGNLPPQLLDLIHQHLMSGAATQPQTSGWPHFLGPPISSTGGHGGRGEGLPHPQLGMPNMGTGIPHDAVDLGGGVIYSPSRGYMHSGGSKAGMGSGSTPY